MAFNLQELCKLQCLENKLKDVFMGNYYINDSGNKMLLFEANREPANVPRKAFICFKFDNGMWVIFTREENMYLLSDRYGEDLEMLPMYSLNELIEKEGVIPILAKLCIHEHCKRMNLSDGIVDPGKQLLLQLIVKELLNTKGTRRYLITNRYNILKKIYDSLKLFEQIYLI